MIFWSFYFPSLTHLYGQESALQSHAQTEVMLESKMKGTAVLVSLVCFVFLAVEISALPTNPPTIQQKQGSLFKVVLV